MSDRSTDWDGSRSAAGSRSPWLLTSVISIPTFMEILDTSIANVSLPNIAGNLGTSGEQATWIVTSYLVANAIIIPISGFLSRAIGRKRYFMLSIALFTAASLACALSPNLGFLIAARIFQGIGGGGLAPVEQSMITDSFPPARRGQAFAAFGLVVVVAPIIGPTIGGYVTDAISWHWIFFINVPVGILGLILTGIVAVEPEPLVRERAERLRDGLKIDYVGFLLTAVGMAGLLITLDRGQIEDWFESDLIIATATMAVLGLGAMTIWEINQPDPIVPLPLLRIPNFAISVVMMLLLGVLVFGTIQIIPQMLQQVFGYTAFDAGLTLTIGGAIAIVTMPLSGIATTYIDTRLILLAAFGMQAFAFSHFSQFSTASTFSDAAQGRFLMSVALPFLFIPINTVAYVGVPQPEYDKASAMLNFFRNLGGAFGISITQTLLVRREQFHQARITEGLTPLNTVYRSAADQLSNLVGGRTEANAIIYRQAQQQASMLSYVEVFHILMWAVIAILPLILLLKTASRGREA
jgi:DHA2 family multidrug resistance protein